DARIDGWIETGSEVTPFYDPMLAKIIVTADTREAAIARLTQALDETAIAGIETNLDYLRAIATSDVFRSGQVATSVLGAFAYRPRTIDVVAPGAQSGVQELPGRLHLWHVGVPPSGPMDERSFRLANRVVGNP
ncbi:MAG TPA: urea carboxylase, partial [Bradyrhizobium sp.]|nr:urea carboxylase [Bradyrhizobium sp.]